jgi:beta-phosphoglucomutase-like phosphatase (HAD superfamily)
MRSISSRRDVVAGHLAGIAVIGFANKPDKVKPLADANADAVVTRLAAISAAPRVNRHAASTQLAHLADTA